MAHPATLHPAVEAASDGELPTWAVVSARRRAHIERVAGLLDTWATGLGVPNEERARWRAAGYLHDALRSAEPSALRGDLPPDLGALPPPLLHGPAAANKLRAMGVDDEELLTAIASHTIGAAGMGRMGRALYVADFLDPGRSFLSEWRQGLRARMPHDMEDVLREVVRARIENLLERGSTVLPQTVAFWNELVA